MKTSQKIGLIGLGVFTYMILNGLSFLYHKIFEESLLFTHFDPIWIYGITEYMTLILVLFSFFLIIKELKKIDLEDIKILKRTFFILVSAFILTQVLAFVLPFIMELYVSTEYFNLKESYFIDIEKYHSIRSYIIDAPVFILKYMVIFILVLREIKLQKHL